VAAKRVLIVDDSKSARVVLSRLLEKHELAVDTTDSAESALDYLRDHRPDVIFMDHVMSGMDGLRAVEVIKSDPTTASIPIMMYTSQDGEVYAGEARAFGAAGVVSKLMAPGDLSKVLDQLQLVPRVTVSAVAPPTDAPAAPLAAGPVTPGAATGSAPLPWPTSGEIRGLVEPLLREHGADLRRFVVASLEGFASRLTTEVRADLGAAVAAVRADSLPLPAPGSNDAPESAPVEAAAAAAPRHRPIARIVLGVLGALGWLAVLASGFIAWQQHRELVALGATLENEAHELAAARLALASAASAAAPTATEIEPAAADASGSAPQRLLVPYGELPLSGPRLEGLQALLADLEQRAFTGVVRVETHVGDFCLTGNPAEGYALAPGEMPANRCDIVGNPFNEALTAAGRQPPAFAALVASLRERSHGRIDIRVTHAGHPPAAAADPAADMSAAQWNAAAAAHNRVELFPEPAPPAP
jgi:CheY-like chemotaxis protein